MTTLTRIIVWANTGDNGFILASPIICALLALIGIGMAGGVS